MSNISKTDIQQAIKYSIIGISFAFFVFSIAIISFDLYNKNSECTVYKNYDIIELKHGFRHYQIYNPPLYKGTFEYDELNLESRWNGLIKIPINNGTLNITCRLK